MFKNLTFVVKAMPDESREEPTTDDELDDEDFSASDNAMSIVGFVLAFLFPILGLIFSIIGFNKSDEVGGQGRGLSIAGIIISSLLLVWVLWALLVGGWATRELVSSLDREETGSSAWVRKQFNADEIDRAVLVAKGDISKIKTTSGQFRYQPAKPETCRYLLANHQAWRSTPEDNQDWSSYSDYLVIEPNSEQTGLEAPDSYLTGPGSLIGELHYVIAENCGDWQLVDDLLSIGN